MGFFDALLGRSQPPQANLDVLFNVPQAAISLQVEGFEFTGEGSVCFRDTEGNADDLVIEQARAVIGTDASSRTEVTTDSFGFTWVSVSLATADASGIAADLHAINTGLSDAGFGTSLLCSTFVFERAGTRCALVYLFKRGTFYPFVPEDASARRRDNALELQIRGLVSADVPVESDLARWLALWGAPGL